MFRRELYTHVETSQAAVLKAVAAKSRDGTDNRGGGCTNVMGIATFKKEIKQGKLQL